MTGVTQTEQEIGAVTVSGGHLWWPNANFCGGSGTAVSSDQEVPRDDWARRLDPLSIRVVKCVQAARRNAELRESVQRPNREGVCVGSALGAQQTRVRYATRLASHGIAGTNPIDFPDSIDGAPAAHVALRWGLQGPNLTLVGGLDCACRTLVLAARQLAFGLADRMHVVLGDVFEPRMRAGFSQWSFDDAAQLWSSDHCVASSEDQHCAASLFAQAVEHDQCSAAVPHDIVLALVLERPEQPSAASSGISLVGFMNSVNAPGRLAPAASHGNIVPMGGQLDAVGIGGVRAVADAWLRLASCNGTVTNASQDEAMRDGVQCCPLANGQWPNLAFVRTEYLP